MKTTSLKEIISLPHPCLTTKAGIIPNTAEGRAKAIETIHYLEDALQPRMPAAGLAAPQINISERVFIFSWNRAPEHLEAVINPSFEPLDEEISLGWEGCFSVPLTLAHVPRHQNILATYTNRTGQQVKYILRGFAARVFQHESDHLDGLENIHRQDAQVKNFATLEELATFITEVKRGDAVNYIKPELIGESYDETF
jgi:peptide deformylase